MFIGNILLAISNSLLIIAGAFAGVRGIRAIARQQWASARTLFAITAVAGMLVWSTANGTLSMSCRVVLILDQPPSAASNHVDRLIELVERLGNAGSTQFAAIAVDDQSSAQDLTTPLKWISAGDAGFQSGVFWNAAPHVQDLDFAIKAAMVQIRRSWQEQLYDLLMLRRIRIVLVHSDPKLWSNWEPLDVDQRLTAARRSGCVIDLAEIDPQPSVLEVRCWTDLDLPAYKPLHDTHVLLHVTLHGAALKGRQGATVTGTLSANLNGTDASLNSYPIHATVLAQEVVEIRFPLSSFTVQNAGQSELHPNFALIELSVDIEIDGKRLISKNSSHLPVRTPHVVVACGQGHPDARLRSRWDATALPYLPGDVQTRLSDVLSSPRCSDVAVFTFETSADFAARLGSGGSLPDLVVLNEFGPADLTPALSKELAAKVRQGLHLMIVDAPVLPADPATASQLQQIIPAWSVPDVSSTPLSPIPQTVDRSPVLCFAFDYNELWSSTSSTYPGGLEAQLQLAEAMLKKYRAMGVLHGELKIGPAPGNPTNRVIQYEALPAKADQMLVCVAPYLSASLSNPDCDSTLANLLIPSLIDLRLAALFPELTSGLSMCGLKSGDAPAALHQILKDGPSILPNVAVVVFAGRKSPQPVAGPLNAGSKQIRYVVDGNESDVRQLLESPPGMVAQLTTRGIHVAVVGLAMPQPSGGTDPTPEHGLHELTIHWPRNETALFSKFSTKPSDLLGTLHTSAVSSCLSAIAPTQAWPIDRTNALARLVTSTSGPFAAELDVTTSSLVPKKSGGNIADRWAALHGSRRDANFAVFSVYGRAVDERFTPAANRTAALAWQSLSSAELAAKVPMTERWSGPRRSRRLIYNPAFGPHDVTDHAFAVTPLAAIPFEPPVPLLVSARAGAGQVFVLPYSLLEEQPNSATWDSQDSIYQAGQGSVDRLGPQRLVDIATFVGRIQSRPLTGPEVRSIETVDGRGGLRFEVGYLKEHLRRPEFFEPRLRSAGKQPDSTDPSLSLEKIDTTRQVATFVASPVQIAGLIPNGNQVSRLECHFDVGQPGANFVASRPSGKAWSDLECIESARVLATYTGGALVGPTGKFVSPFLPVRYAALTSLMLILAGAAFVRGASQIWNKERRQALRQEAEHLRRLNVDGAADDLGDFRAEQTTTRPSPFEVVHKTPFRGSGDPRSIVRDDLLLWSYGQPVIPKIIHRHAPRAARTMIVTNVGATMRLKLRLGHFEPKIAIAAAIARCLSVMAAREGSEVTLAASGVRGDDEQWQTSGPWIGGLNAEELDAFIGASQARQAEPFISPESLAILPETDLFWISDFVEETAGQDSQIWLRWARNCASEGIRVTAIHVSSITEEWQTGWVLAMGPSGLSDRTGLTRTDIATLIREQQEELRSSCDLMGISFVSLHSTMDTQQIVQAFRESNALQ